VLFDSAWDFVVPREHGASDVAVRVAWVAVWFWQADVDEGWLVVGGVVGCWGGNGVEQLAGGVRGHRNP